MTNENQSPEGVDERAAFEATFGKHQKWEDPKVVALLDQPLCETLVGKYVANDIQKAWEAWQARAALAAQPQADDADVRELSKWLNEEPNRPLDRAALARVLAARRLKATLSNDEIRDVFLANGFTVKDGQTDLKPYVFAAARALLAAARPAPAEGDALPEPAGRHPEWDNDAQDYRPTGRHYTVDQVRCILITHHQPKGPASDWTDEQIDAVWGRYDQGYDTRRALIGRILATSQAPAPAPAGLSIPDGYRAVLVPEGEAPPEPDWDEVKRQAEVATGLKVEQHTFSIVIREVRRWITQRDDKYQSVPNRAPAVGPQIDDPLASERVEAAARALAAKNWVWEQLPTQARQIWRERARAALAAAMTPGGAA